MGLAKQLGDRVRLPHILGDEVLDVVMINSHYGRVMVEIPIADGSDRVVEYINVWYDADEVEAAWPRRPARWRAWTTSWWMWSRGTLGW